MTLGGAPLSLLGGAFAAGAGALVALYVLKLRRRRVEAPFAGLWQRVLSERESTALWRRLRRLVSLALQLLLLGLLLFAVGDPRLGASRRARTVVIMVDTSASMQATDGGGGKTRLERAREEARRLVRGLGADETALVLRLEAEPELMGSFESSVGEGEGERELERQIDRLEASDTPADLDRGLRLAADILRGRPRPTLVLIGDGAYDAAVLARVRTGHEQAPGARDLGAIDLGGIDLRFSPVGSGGDNLALTAFAVRRYRANQTAYEVLVELQSFRAQPEAVRLELVQDGEVVNVERLPIKPGERLQRRYPNLAGEGTRLEARLKPENGRPDLLPVDDHAFALLSPRRKLKVMLVGAPDLFLEGALLLDDNIAVSRVAPSAYRAADTARFDAVVLDGVTPTDAPRCHALYIDPRGPGSPFAIHGEVGAPLVTAVASDHPLMRWVALKDLNIARASRLALEPGDVAVAAAVRDPIIAARERGGRKTVALGFALQRSDLPLRMAFPVLVVNALEWFEGDASSVVTSYRTGRPWRVAAPPGVAELTVRGPDGALARAPVHDGRASLGGRRVGFYEITAPGAPARGLAANLASAAESRIEPHRELVIGGQTVKPPEPGRVGVRRQLWSYLVLLALLLTGVEWWTYNRRFTV